MKTYSRRDLTVISGFGGKSMVLACDSCGAAGQKPGDKLTVPPYYTGKLTARVCLTELLCCGAVPSLIGNVLSCEMEPTGREIIRGIEDELAISGHGDVHITGSTEENFETIMTAAGIFAVGFADDTALRFGRAMGGDKLLLFGRPLSGSDVLLDSPGFYFEISHLLGMNEVRELVPVGSKGIGYEAMNLAALDGLRFAAANTGVDLACSAGPASCLLVLCSDSISGRIRDMFPSALVIGAME